MSETVDLHHQIDGPDGAPVVVLGSSIGTSGAMWEPQVAALSRRYRVVRYDHRGHGRSPVPRGPYALDDLGRDVLALLDHLGLERVAYGGLSLGGMVGMWLGDPRARAHHLARAVLHLGLPRSAGALGGADRPRPPRGHPVARRGDDAPLVQRGHALAAAPPFVRQLTQGMADTPDEGYAGCCAAIGEMDLRDQIHAITAPTLVICGAEDPSTPLPMALEHLRARSPTPSWSSCPTRPTWPRSSNPSGPRRPSSPTSTTTPTTTPAAWTVRRAVLGDAHVDRAIAGTTPFTAPFQDLITRYAWGDVWNRPGLDRATRSAITLALLTALDQPEELAMHVRAARRNGLTAEQISEVLLHSAVYCGVPAANVAFAVANAVLAEEDPGRT